MLPKRPASGKPSGRGSRPRTIAVRQKPGDRLKALVRAGPVAVPAALGRGGITSFKREGDGGTPRAAMAVLGGFRRGGLLAPDRSGIALSRVGPGDGWCDAPSHAAYNRQVRLPFAASHETLMRTDALYDFGYVLDWNIRARRRGGGSAIFLHVARPGYRPTEGCIALSRRDLLRLMPFLRRGTRVRVV
ncbi:L,D-transpeptidase family protein [Hoeflea sp. BAL378]|uniref:L,D-transpeptidase family protein n=1 Tax=Hoeflea sp. BAL378 TaxID=1547437 RepID=UPI0009DCA47A|nr:L,D-transpeptidase family protein [Hoeflea sp. BAL378]